MSSEPPRRGELYFADLEDIGQKLVLVVSRDEVNERLNPVVCLVTSTDRERTVPSFVTIDPPEGGVWKPSAILCHALLTIERWRLAPECLGSVSARTLAAVSERLAWVLDEESVGTDKEDASGAATPEHGADRSADSDSPPGGSEQDA